MKLYCVIVLSMLLSPPGAYPQERGGTLRLTQTIPLTGVEGRIDHMAVNDDHTRLYVAALGNNTVEVIDLAAGKRVQSLTGFAEPQGVAVVVESNDLVVASGHDGKCRIYDSALAPKAVIDDLDDADNVRFDRQSKRIYVGFGNGALAVIDPNDGTKVGEIKLAGHPESFQLEMRRPRIYVNVPTAHHVAVVDRDKSAVVATWPIKEAAANFPMALDEEHRRVFVGCRKPAKLLVMDTESGAPVASLACCGDTDDIFYDDHTKRLYLTGGEGCISVFEQIDADHYRPAGTVATAAGARTSLFVPARRMLYVAVPHRGKQPAELRVYAVDN
jgi:hypothetical protein